MTDRHLNRRQAMAGIGAVSAAAIISSKVHAQEPERAALATRGVVYDTGTYFGYEGYLSRMSWHESDVRNEIRTVRDELNCNSIQIVGTELSRLDFATTVAAEHGLRVWFQPRLMESTADAQLAHLLEGARIAARARQAGADIVLSVGCETTLFQRGLVPGELFSDRMQPLFSARGDDAARIVQQFNLYLARAAEAAREIFEGPLTYSAGSWEQVDWRVFDLVAVNLYRDSNNRENYRETLRSYLGNGKPVHISEFGSCTFEGAADYGGGGFMIVDYSTGVPRIPEGFVRSEAEQAGEIADLLGIFAEEGVAGAFVYNFLSQFDTHSDDPRQDVDMASHAIVKSMPGDVTAPIAWEPKLAFHEVARLYRDL